MDRWNYRTERTDWTAGLTLSPLVHRSISSRSPLVQQSMVQRSYLDRAMGAGGPKVLQGACSHAAVQSSVQPSRQSTRPTVLGFSSQSITPSD